MNMCARFLLWVGYSTVLFVHSPIRLILSRVYQFQTYKAGKRLGLDHSDPDLKNKEYVPRASFSCVPTEGLAHILDRIGQAIEYEIYATCCSSKICIQVRKPRMTFKVDSFHGPRK